MRPVGVGVVLVDSGCVFCLPRLSLATITDSGSVATIWDFVLALCFPWEHCFCNGMHCTGVVLGV